MKKYLVTGGAGFIGSHTVDHLLANGQQVVVLDNFSSGHRDNLPDVHPHLTVIEGDIRDISAVAEAAKDVTHCLHLAAQVSVVKSLEDPVDSATHNILGFINVLNAVKKNNAKRFVYASSAATYGNPKTLPLPENEPLGPESPYGLEKQINELYVKLFKGLYDISSCGMRFFNVYGPRQDPKSPYAGVIALFADAVIAKQTLTINGDGLQTRDFIFVNDVARANEAALDSDYEGAVNVATGSTVTLLELIEVLEKIVGHECKKTFGPEREGDIKHSAAMVDVLQNKLNITAKHSLEEGLRELLDQTVLA
ncbi:MAG: NAD-dependent epimerase/dehydratase family protein [Pseudomonadota bacterium]